VKAIEPALLISAVPAELFSTTTFPLSTVTVAVI